MTPSATNHEIYAAQNASPDRPRGADREHLGAAGDPVPVSRAKTTFPGVLLLAVVARMHCHGDARQLAVYADRRVQRHYREVLSWC